MSHASNATRAMAGARLPAARYRAFAFVGIAALSLAGCASSRNIVPVLTTAIDHGAPAGPAEAPAAPFQYLFGSGEASAISVQSWRGIVAHVAAQVQARPANGIVLAADATLAAPRFVPCGVKPFAVIFDVDETVLLNTGFESDEAAHPGRAFVSRRFEQWERTGTGKAAPVPGARPALEAIRALGVTVVFNTNRTVGNAAFTEATLAENGLGPAKHGETLFLAGDDATGGHKDGRRATVAARYCVVAMGGDQLGDFSDLFNDGLAPQARRAAVSAPPLSRLWGAGWFVMPNPIYGTAIKGGTDDLFPADKRWASSETEKN